MKSHLKLLLALAVMVAAGVAQNPPATSDSSSAQTATQPAARGHHGGHRGGHGAGMERMAKQLNLTDDQKTQWQSAMKSERDQAQAIRNDSSLSEADKKTRIRSLRRDSHEKLMSMLTDEQKTKLKEMRKDHRGKRAAKRGAAAPGAGATNQ